jgi:hypothetical protein
MCGIITTAGRTKWRGCRRLWVALLPAPPCWLVEKLLADCASRPGPALASWLKARGIAVEFQGSEARS